MTSTHVATRPIKRSVITVPKTGLKPQYKIARNGQKIAELMWKKSVKNNKQNFTNVVDWSGMLEQISIWYGYSIETVVFIVFEQYMIYFE